MRMDLSVSGFQSRLMFATKCDLSLKYRWRSSSSLRAGNKAHLNLSPRSKSIAVNCRELRRSDDCNNDTEAFYMRKCVELARKGMGQTSPNPMVGCVIVNNGVVVGEGFHPKAGQPHAEVLALRDAKDLAENGTAYVSLEPCDHHGRTPPCTEALIRARVKRVVVGMIDPNPIVASRGIERLKNAGINVVVGVEEDLCTRLNDTYASQFQKDINLARTYNEEHY